MCVSASQSASSSSGVKIKIVALIPPDTKEKRRETSQARQRNIQHGDN